MTNSSDIQAGSRGDLRGRGDATELEAQRAGRTEDDLQALLSASPFGRDEHTALGFEARHQLVDFVRADGERPECLGKLIEIDAPISGALREELIENALQIAPHLRVAIQLPLG